MDAIIWGIVLLCIAVLFLYGTREHMTNADLLSTLKTFGEQTPPKAKNRNTQNELPMYGPEASAPAEPTPAPPSGNPHGDSSLYPQIYGPDIVATPGKKPKNGKTQSDNTEDSNYDFNPDLQRAFPTNGPPQPFLGDFSKFQR